LITAKQLKFWAVVFRHSKPGASSPGVLCVLHRPYINSSPIFVHKFKCTGELLSPCHSVMLALYFGAPALEELDVLNFLSTPPTCYLTTYAAVRVTGDCTHRYWKACCLS